MSTDNSRDVLIGHPDEADGIDEYDNPMPGWLQFVFWGTIVMAIFIMLDWHVVTPRSVAAIHEAEMVAAHERWGEFVPVAVVVDDAHIAAGQALWTTNCVACHAADGTGGIGPSLVDAEWVHGNTPDEINTTIFYGVDGKGMPAWGYTLGPQAAADLAAYVVSLQAE